MTRRKINVLRHSSLYETSPVGIKDQPKFLNAAVLATTKYRPMDLIRNLKEIELEMGRDMNGIRNGPRPIDLDIIFYGDENVEAPELIIPHPRWSERNFVKIPLKDLSKLYKSVDTDSRLKVKNRMREVEEVEVQSTEEEVEQVFAFGPDKVERFGKFTWLMFVLNLTPDSFSDGGLLLDKEQRADKTIIMKRVEEALKAGANIIDIGAQSTRPHSERVTEDEELKRLGHAIRMLREEFGPDCPYISVDTFYSRVVEEAVKAGADIANDVSSGRMDPSMLPKVVELDVPMILMHMRGTPQTMTERENIDYSDDPVADIGKELQQISERAMEAGLPPWKQILDPGFGFAKEPPTSLRLAKELQRLRSEFLKGPCSKAPLLVGVSRKGFLKNYALSTEASDRDVVSATMAVDCIRNGADIIRAHNAAITREAINVADALYKK